MAQYDMTREITEAGLTVQEVHEAAERIKRYSATIDGDSLYGWSRRGESVVRQAIAQLVRGREAAERAAAGAVEVQWKRYEGRWLIAGADLTTGMAVTAVRRDGQAEDMWVGRIVGTLPDGRTVAEHTYVKES